MNNRSYKKSQTIFTTEPNPNLTTNPDNYLNQHEYNLANQILSRSICMHWTGCLALRFLTLDTLYFTFWSEPTLLSDDGQDSCLCHCLTKTLEQTILRFTGSQFYAHLDSPPFVFKMVCSQKPQLSLPVRGCFSDLQYLFIVCEHFLNIIKPANASIERFWQVWTGLVPG